MLFVQFFQFDLKIDKISNESRSEYRSIYYKNNKFTKLPIFVHRTNKLRYFIKSSMTPITITIFLKTALLIYFELNFLFLQLITRPIMWVTVNDRSKEKANARVATIFPPGFFLTKQSAKRIYVTSPVGTVVRKTYRRNFGQKLFRTAVHKTRG